MTKIAGSGSISQRHGSADPDPDPHQNVMDPQHWSKVGYSFFSLTVEPGGEGTGTQLTGTGNQLIPYLGTNLLELLFDLLV